MFEIPYEAGALYSRQLDIHAPFGGQQRGGISTPTRAPMVVIFTGEAGKTHGYHDYWDDYGIFHYFGEGQSGDMRMAGGNRAILRHQQDGKHLLLFQMMGKSRPYRYLGEFECLSYYEKEGILDTNGSPRKALVFRLQPIADIGTAIYVNDGDSDTGLDKTVSAQTVEVRTKQSLFRRRLIGVEKECRITGIRDLRFVRASHIKPWSACATGNERTDGHNGLLLSPTADHLFDSGWISFGHDGRLLRTDDLPSEVLDRLGLDLTNGRSVGSFNAKQLPYLEYHRNAIFQKRYKQSSNPQEAIIKALGQLP
ncbi:HNH endonuclease [Pseudoxanthomonas sp. 10H]|uniref:HNH endonuclease n=1 Tax=Pseudoxanthomonas sp. 10H TaxID=3242729 RepID=UPI0035575AD7